MLKTLNEDEQLVYPNACLHCDVLKEVHYNSWHDVMSWHQWVEPDDKTRLARMLRIREARLHANGN